jgi:1-deoxy-D-xylulose-5-phosphate synthase
MDPRLHGDAVLEKKDIAILCFGARLGECLKAAKDLEAKGKTVTVADARFAKPLDTDLIRQLVTSHRQLITIEEGSRGGFGAHVLEFIHNDPIIRSSDHPIPIIRTLTLPDIFQDHDDPAKQYAEAGLTAVDIAKAASI